MILAGLLAYLPVEHLPAPTLVSGQWSEDSTIVNQQSSIVVEGSISKSKFEVEQPFTIHDSPFTKDYSYGDSAGFAPASLFVPIPIAIGTSGTKISGKCNRQIDWLKFSFQRSVKNLFLFTYERDRSTEIIISCWSCIIVPATRSIDIITQAISFIQQIINACE
jgi:hypothetical protein